jgi:hypothetical protein
MAESQEIMNGTRYKIPLSIGKNLKMKRYVIQKLRVIPGSRWIHKGIFQTTNASFSLKEIGI